MNKIRDRALFFFQRVRQHALSIRQALTDGRDVSMYFRDNYEDLNSAIVVTMLNNRAAEHLVCD
jgi:hypothetical protein